MLTLKQFDFNSDEDKNLLSIRVFVQIVDFADSSIQIVISDSEGSFDRLAAGFPGNDPVTVLGVQGQPEDLSERFAGAFSKKLKKPVFVSYNLPPTLDPKSVNRIQKKIVDSLL